MVFCFKILKGDLDFRLVNFGPFCQHKVSKIKISFAVPGKEKIPRKG